MPANLTPQYYEAEEAYRNAATVEEKMEALKEMLSVIPKHKGTEKLQGDIKRRLSRLREEKQKKSKAAAYNPFNVEKQGAGQVVLVGYPNTGKSSLVASMTRAKVKVAPYPFTTTVPSAGMMPYENILIQLVDTPPLSSEGFPPGLLNTLRVGDLLLVIVDAGSDDCLEHVEETLSLLHQKKVITPGPELENDPHCIPFLVVATKMDLPQSRENLKIIQELKPDLPITAVSAGGNDEEARLQAVNILGEKLYRALKIIRVYTRAPGKPADLETPFVLKKGGTVVELAHNIHRDFPGKLKNARVWGSAKFDGQTVARDYVLEDGDIVELNV